MNIGLFTDTYFPQVSGVSTSIKLLRNQLVKHGHRVIIFTTTDPNAVPEEDVVRLPSVPFVSFEDRRIAYAGMDRCLKISRDYELDLVHTHTEFSLGMIGKHIAHRMKIPWIHTYHTMYENYTHYILNGHLVRPLHVKLLSKMFCNGTDGVIAPSQLTHDKLREYGVNVPIRIIPTGVEVPEYRPDVSESIRKELSLNETQPVLLSLSRLSKEKNIAAVIDAFVDIYERKPQVKLVIVGDGPEREPLEQQVKALGIEDSVIFTGQIDYDNVWKYYQMATLYVNASSSESQGLTYLEAFVNRLPIIAKRNDYLSEVMTDRSLGALFDTEESFAQTVHQYLEAQSNGEVAEISVEQLYELSAECFGERVATYYEETIANFPQDEEGLLGRMYANAKSVYDEFIGGKDGE